VHQLDQASQHQQLVGERVEEAAERALEVEVARQPAVEEVGD
jgi:hypothetical protein